MKKVFFGAAALVFSCALFAQAPQGPLTAGDSFSSTDSSIDAEIVPHLAGPSTGNTGLSIQNGNTNKVQVRQAGINQSVYTNQSDGLGTGNNRARIWQTGDVMPGPSGDGNASDVRQIGTDNQSDIAQEGDFNEAVTRQGMKTGLGLSERNKSYINHGISENGEHNYAMVEQDGLDNSSKTIQLWDNNEARTVQEGDNNIADVRQVSGPPNNAAGHSALAEQYGDDNTIKMRQWGSNSNSARSVQEGVNNKSNQFQTSNGGSGVGNEAVVDQGAAFIVDIPSGSFTALVNTFGLDDMTTGTFNGASENAEALQVQTGTANGSSIGQYGDGSSVGNYAEQRQNGDANAAMIVQNAYGNANGGDNYARQDQVGDRNSAGVAQNGSDHLAYQRQIGNDNTAYSTQRGSDNHLSTYQGGDNNILETVQRGQNNTILLVQKEQGFGGHSYRVTQNLSDAFSNGGNIVDVLQLGPNGDFAADAEGCDFQPQVELDCPDPLVDFDIANPCGPGGC